MDTALVIGALLGTQVNREVSIVNSFELIVQTQVNECNNKGEIKDMVVDLEFLDTRIEQCVSCVLWKRVKYG